MHSAAPDRSCGEGGVWRNARQPDGTTKLIRDAEDLHRRLAPEPHNWAMLNSEIRSKKRRAEQGKCTFGRGARFDVDVMDCVIDVYELKFGPRRTADGTNLRVRVYFAEPKQPYGLILGLAIMGKRDHPLGRSDQDAHAVEAQRRYDEWVTDPRYA